MEQVQQVQAQPQDKETQLLHDLTKDSHVKKMGGAVPFTPSLNLFDISLKARARKEDQVFASNAFLRHNVRRGLSFLEESNKGATVCRKGLEKFFDLITEYLDILDGKKARLKKDEKKLFHIIFDKVKETLVKGGKVTVYKTEKANGENAHISYNAAHDAWIIASKNASMMIRNAEDIKAYTQLESSPRFPYAALIAEAWLDMLEKQVVSVQELKKELVGRSLVGEYCGHPMHQHLVEYSKISIIFFAMVDLHGESNCYPMNATHDFLKKHGLPMVRITPRKECSNISELVQVLREISKEVAQSTIEEDAEGSVLYFEGKVPEGETEILTLCKVKTLEYRFYRKIREKLKNILIKGKAPNRLVKDYKKECRRLADGCKTPKPLEYYFEVAELAFTFVAGHLEIARRLGLNHRYLDFLKVIRGCHANGAKPKVDDFKKILESANTLSDESDLGDEGEKEEEENASEEEKGEEEEDNEEREKQKSVEKKKKGHKKTEGEEERKIEDKNRGRKRVIGIIFTGLPGMGKTTNLSYIIKTLEERGHAVSVISSDKVRKEIMEEILKEEPQLTHDEAFNKSSRGANPRFTEYVEKAVKKTGSLPQAVHVVILDKNHPPAIIQSGINIFKKLETQVDHDMRVVVVKPECVQGFETHGHVYPFSLGFLVKCIQRAVGRGEHETLVGSDEKIVNVLVWFYSGYKDFKAVDSTFKQMGADLLISLPFTNEDQETEEKVKEALGECVGDILKEMKGFDIEKEKLNSLIEKVKNLKVELKDPERELVHRKAVEAVEKCLELFK